MRKLKETVADVEWLVSEWDYNTNSALGIFPDKIQRTTAGVRTVRMSVPSKGLMIFQLSVPI